jgi:hypothetical protein
VVADPLNAQERWGKREQWNVLPKSGILFSVSFIRPVSFGKGQETRRLEVPDKSQILSVQCALNTRCLKIFEIKFLKMSQSLIFAYTSL